MANRLAGSKSDPVQRFAPTRRELIGARHLPGDIYYSPEIYRKEIENIWLRDWICVGRVEQFENPGDFRAIRVAGEPVVIVKNRENKINAMANVCRHRGVEVARLGAGKAEKFSCPYHGWVYNLNGKLIGAPFTRDLKNAGGFDTENCRLPRINLDTWGGYVFINFDPNCTPLSMHLDDEGIRGAEILHPEKTRISDEYTFVLNCNWKFVPENLMDIYHAKAIHGQSFAKHFTQEGFDFRLGPHGRYYATYESNTMAPDGEILFGPMPWMTDKSRVFAYTVYVRPNMNIFGRQDLIQPWICLPLGPEKTQITIWTQLPEEFFDWPAFAEKNKIYSDFIRVVADEDAAMLESLQNGVHSRNYEPGPTVGLEKAIHHFLNYWIDRMYGDGPRN